MKKCLGAAAKKLAVCMTMLLYATVLLCAACLCMQTYSYADGVRLVKVAFFPMDGYHITRSDGSLDGMDVAYLDEISDYARWDVVYVECASWEEALQLLKDEKVDLVGSAQYSAQRAEDYVYADLSSGYTFGVIATNPDSVIAYEDYEAMKDITFGMVSGYVRENEFLQYMQDNGIFEPTIRKYETTAELQDALSAGEVDAFVHTFTEMREGQRMIGRFAPRPFYYITYPGNDDVLRELNQAIADLKMNRPELEEELMNEFYYSRFDKSALLTLEEKAYLKENQSLRVGFVDGHYPFSYADGEEFMGLSREILENGIAVTGQHLAYVGFADEEEARTALEDGRIDILAYCVDSEETLSQHHLVKTRDYVHIPLVLVMDEGSTMGGVGTVVTVPYLQDKVGQGIGLDEAKVKVFDSQAECLRQVKAGEADAAYCDGYFAEDLLRTDFGYRSLQIKNVFSADYPISVAVREEDELLAGILSKTIAEIDSQAISEYMMRENIYPLVDIRNYIEEHSFFIIGFLICIVVAVVAVAAYIIRDERTIQKLMYKDASMDIWNLNYLIYKGEKELASGRRGRRYYAAVCLNLRQFRRFNVINGWSVGDRLLRQMAETLMGLIEEPAEICARDYGDRFVILLAADEPGAFAGRLQMIKQSLEDRIYEETENRMLVQMGYYVFPPQMRDIRSALGYASQALESAGEQAENAVRSYDEQLERELKERHEREKLLESVDIRKDFAAYYQPKVDIRTGKIVGAEALVRFLDPTENGAVRTPGFFVPYYEQSGRITEVDFFVYESVCKMLRKRLDAGEKVVPISCNFSRMHFLKQGFIEQFEQILDRYQIPKDLIEVEITETVVLEEMQQKTAKNTLNTMHEKAIRLSIDDFGSGYSSLGVLEQIPASVVKLDRSFLLNQEDRERQISIMRSVVNLADELHANVVCEGVETEEDIRLMGEIGANVAQGYYYFHPIPQEEFERQLDAD